MDFWTKNIINFHLQVTPMQGEDGTQIQIIKIPEQLDQNVIQLVEMDSQAPVAPAPTYSVRQKEPEIEPPVGNVSEHF